MEFKDLIHDEAHWFINPIHAPYAFEEGNMANISPTIKINIFDTQGIEENITLGAHFTPEEIEAYTKLFKEFSDFFSWSYSEMPRLDPAIVEHHIDT